ncbi:hypothetical protein I6J18_11070 [Peribacillus psychrosaccharolyticus]|uniref:Uncharacterized protein n=1 Tax=Peribacillus psychrosaccharolyticus TaxID=1407 RepID=A0A974S282_PERPY|nr:hypothetical protein [Peribacillus psychrosaccharolyticus]MEC2057151.1 hypothetical protein [Peribacillus psychrosaccharolyticus]MED3745073.1 hypothetical protein [Peribacillus psychrosaccharolyticus]QQT02321.1 hypothetical protein I6J18_11070 [Peribacillus psychrosaccharolyticus]
MKAAFSEYEKQKIKTGEKINVLSLLCSWKTPALTFNIWNTILLDEKVWIKFTAIQDSYECY